MPPDPVPSSNGSLSLPRVDYSLMGRKVPPICGPGSETMAHGWSWCGYCGYTGRCVGPTQLSCPERRGWHRWLQHNADRYLPDVER